MKCKAVQRSATNTQLTGTLHLNLSPWVLFSRLVLSTARRLRAAQTAPRVLPLLKASTLGRHILRLMLFSPVCFVLFVQTPSRVLSGTEALKASALGRPSA